MYKYLNRRLKRVKNSALNLAVFLAFVTIIAISVSAQQESGQISGNVKDANDAVIPGATLTVKNTATNSTRVVTTNNEGFYLVSNLQPGTYSITASKQEFAEAQETVQVTVGGRITVNLTAGVQNVQAETVDVNIGGGAEINTTDQQLSTTVTGKQIQSLPTLNRTPYALVNLSGNNFNLGFTDPFDPKYDYGYADFDIRHRFVASFNYDFPFAKTFSNGFAKTLLDGFSLNGILTANTGTPFTVYDCTNAITTCLRIKPTGSLLLKSHTPSRSAGANVFTYLDLAGNRKSFY